TELRTPLQRCSQCQYLPISQPSARRPIKRKATNIPPPNPGSMRPHVGHFNGAVIRNAPSDDRRNRPGRSIDSESPIATSERSGRSPRSPRDHTRRSASAFLPFAERASILFGPLPNLRLQFRGAGLRLLGAGQRFFVALPCIPELRFEFA